MQRHCTSRRGLSRGGARPRCFRPFSLVLEIYFLFGRISSIFTRKWTNVPCARPVTQMVRWVIPVIAYHLLLCPASCAVAPPPRAQCSFAAPVSRLGEPVAAEPNSLTFLPPPLWAKHRENGTANVMLRSSVGARAAGLCSVVHRALGSDGVRLVAMAIFAWLSPVLPRRPSGRAGMTIPKSTVFKKSGQKQQQNRKWTDQEHPRAICGPIFTFPTTTRTPLTTAPLAAG